MAKILLVEDDVHLANSIKQYLAMEHHCVEVAYDGDDGWTRLENEQFDVVILDWNLPLLSGIDLLRKFRLIKGTTPIIMLTARGGIREKESGFDSGADDYLTKPFSVRELAARVKALLRRPANYLDKVLQVGDLKLDAERFLVMKGEKQVQLSRIDFALLEFFMRHPTQIFSAQVLLERVWNSDSEVTAEALRTSIKRIRRKLDHPEQDSIIENVSRVGYRLRVTASRETGVQKEDA